MAIIINASEVLKYKESPLILPCKTEQEIIIQDVPPIDRSVFLEKLKCKTDKFGNDVFSDMGNDDVNVKREYSKKENHWKISIKIENKIAALYEIYSFPIAVPEVFDFHIKFQMVQCIESMLAVDLGNTRSCALLCYDIRNITHHDGIQIHKLPLHSYTDNKTSDVGVFDSFISFSKDPKISFTRIGKEAIPVANTLRVFKGSGDFYLSSPKRYYWDDDENSNGWKVLNEGKSVVRLHDIPTAQALASMFDTTEIDNLPRSAVLASMLIEILEQAERYLDRDSSFSANELPKVISHVCVTFPAGWNKPECEKYRKVLQAAVDIYQSYRYIAQIPITLDVTCDEATAVLLCYIYGEIAKYSGCADTWLRAIGRTASLNTERTHVRIAVIDVGGGTNDLVIANIQNKKSETGLNLQIDKLYKDGTNKAGDLLLQKVTEQILVKKIAEGTITSNAPEATKKSYISQFSQRLNALSADAKIKQLTRCFWFPLAIEFISGINHNKTKIGLPDNFSLLLEIIKEHADWSGNNINENLNEISIENDDKNLFAKIVTATFRDTAKLFGAAIYAFDADLVILSGKTTETELIAQIFQKYCYLPGNRFISMWNYMIGDWCSIADAGKINDSKYTTAIGAIIYGITNHNFPIQVLETSIRTQNAQGLNDGNCFWGIANNGYFFAEDAILQPGCNEKWIRFSGHPKLLARKRFDVDASEAAISYELRIKPLKKRLWEWKRLWENYSAEMNEEFSITFDKNLSKYDCLITMKNKKTLKASSKIDVTVGFNDMDDTQTVATIKKVKGSYEDGTEVAKDDLMLFQKPTDRLLDGSINIKLLLQTDSFSRAKISIAEVNGKYADGAVVNKEDLEIRIRTSGEELFWLDSGKI